MQHNIHKHDNIKTYYTYIQNNIETSIRTRQIKLHKDCLNLYSKY